MSLQYRASLKQDRLGHVSPHNHFSRAPDEHLCPVRHIQEYVTQTQSVRSSRVLFATKAPPHGVAAHGTFHQWFASILQQAGIDATPGSSRASVASTAILRGLADNTIMESADCHHLALYMLIISATFRPLQCQWPHLPFNKFSHNAFHSFAVFLQRFHPGKRESRLKPDSLPPLFIYLEDMNTLFC